MKLLDGKEVSEKVREEIKAEVAILSKKHGRPPGLAVVLVGENPASRVYVSSKIKACLKAGIESFEHHLPENTSAKDLKTVIKDLNNQPDVDGILVQLPLPKHLDSDEVLSWVDPKKDADCLTSENLGKLWIGKPLTLPCTPAGVMEILNHYQLKVDGLMAAVVGRSQIVGKPMAHLLTSANATVTLCHSHTKDLRSVLKNCDLVVVAAGKPEFLKKEDFKVGAIIIDVGIHRKGKQLVGDVDYESAHLVAGAITPVPGGVGPMTITMLLKNTVTLFKTHV